MTKRIYLHRKRDRLYFRRRIPGLSTKTAPISVALGTTDAVFGHIWSEHLSQEFDRMLEQIMFMSPPLPQQLVVRYFESSLSEILFGLQREIRLARITGRISESYVPNKEIQPSSCKAWSKMEFSGSCPRSALTQNGRQNSWIWQCGSTHMKRA